MVEDNYRQIYSWAKILEKIIANTTTDIAKECADFCFAIIQFNFRMMQSDREKTLTPKFAIILEYVKQVKSGNVQKVYSTEKDNYEQLITWIDILESINDNLDLDILNVCASFFDVIIKACIVKMRSDRERSFVRKLAEIVETIKSYNPYLAFPVTNNSIYEKIEKAQPPIPKIIHYCWLSNDPIPELLQQCMKSWREKLPDYKFILWNFDRFDINSSAWVKQAFEAKKYAFAADYIRLYAVYNHGGIYLDMDVEVIKPFDELLFTDCMIAHESDNHESDNSANIRIEAGCFGAVKGHSFIRQCLEFYWNRNFYPEKLKFNWYMLPNLMGAIYTAHFKDKITVFSKDYFSAKSGITGITIKTKNTHAIHHFENSWFSDDDRLNARKKWEYYRLRISQKELDNAISLLYSSLVLIKGIEYISMEVAKRIDLSETYNKNKHLSDKNVFDAIYHRNYWGSGESRSGKGSELNTTKKLREFLPYIWDKYQIKTVLDVPCGDYNWMRVVSKTGINYIGGDIVAECIENNKKQYQEEYVSFRVLDIISDELPKADMIICKDCLQHLSNEDIWKTLNNFKKSGSTWLLVTSYPLTLKNWDIQNGDYRPLNLLIEPFNINNYIEKIHETISDNNEPDKMMFLYRLSDLKLESSSPVLAFSINNDVEVINGHNCNSYENKSIIPKIINQIWSGKDGPLPDLLKEWGQTWKNYHPGWKYELWDNSRINLFIQEFFPEYVDIYNQFPYDIQRWDAIRYLILWKIGGMYVDFDYECQASFEDIIQGNKCCFSMEPETHIHPEQKETSFNFNNALMACPPNHPFMEIVIKEVFSEKECKYPLSDKFHYVLSTTGPIILMNVYQQYKDKDGIYLIPAELVSPFGWKEIKVLSAGIKNEYFENKLKKAKAIHYFWGSWK